MKHPITNETLTAYILGELDDAEREAVDEALKENEVLRHTKAELESAARIAKEVLQADAVPGLKPEQRDTIREWADTKNEQARNTASPRRYWRRVAAIAATFIVLAGVGALLNANFFRHRISSVMNLSMREQSSESERLPNADTAVAMATLPPRSGEESRNLPESVVKEETDFSEFDYGKGGSASGAPGNVGFPMVAVSESTENGSIPVPPPAPPQEQPSEFVEGRTRLAEKAAEGAAAAAGPQYSGTPTDYFNIESVRQTDTSQHPPFNNDPNRVYWSGHNTEAYDHIVENAFLDVTQNPLSTFSIDVDTASYSNVRRFLNEGSLPPKGAVRIEELVNYFPYDYTPPDVAPEAGGDPFAAHVEVAACPWNAQHRLARIALKGWEIPRDKRPATNLVFLIDVSGSMQPENKLPLLKQSMKMLAENMTDMDHIALAVYAGASGLVLPSTNGEDRQTVLEAIDHLEAGGSTNGGAGIQLAYDTAAANFIEGGVNRVVLATDGDFNVGVTDQDQLVRMVEEKAKSGVFLTVLGFGMGNLKDSNLEKLADKGNGNYAYIDTLNEARKVLVEEMSGTLITIAKDVKIQVEFNPARVGAYRLIGYENRILAAEDFNDDTKDAGEIGAGHAVTALYELVPAGSTIDLPNVDELKYQQPKQAAETSATNETLTLKLRYKQPDGDTSKKLEFPVVDDNKPWTQSSPDFRFAAAVASFGMLLRDSEHKGETSFDAVTEWAQEGLGDDQSGYRKEFLELVGKARALKR